MQGVLLGISNTAGVLAGVLGTAATGYILQNGKLPHLVCLFLFLFFSSKETERPEILRLHSCLLCDLEIINDMAPV